MENISLDFYIRGCLEDVSEEEEDEEKDSNKQFEHSPPQHPVYTGNTSDYDIVELEHFHTLH